MTKNEKEIIYDLLQTTEAWLCKTPLIPAVSPVFTDDIITVQAMSLHESEQHNTEKMTHAKTATGDSLVAIAHEVRQCDRCILCQTRTQAVPGTGVSQPLVLVVGEAPGADEDASGLPFVGKAGQLLDKMLSAIKLSRETNCFIANTVKCRPPQNRDPLPDEVHACHHFLQEQIQLLKPKVILAVGRVATQILLDTTQGINALRGKWFSYQGIPLIATYHPSALLRNEDLKRPAWGDLKTLKAKLEMLYD